MRCIQGDCSMFVSVKQSLSGVRFSGGALLFFPPIFCHYLKSLGERNFKTIRETASSDVNCSLWDHSPRKAQSGKMAAASHSWLEAGIAILWRTGGRLLWGFSLSRSFSLLLAVLGTKDLGVVCVCWGGGSSLPPSLKRSSAALYGERDPCE